MGLPLRAQAALREESRQRESRHRNAWQAAQEAKAAWRAEMLTAELTAETLAVSTRTLRRWVADGRLPVVRLGDCDQSPIRFRRHDVETLKATISNAPPATRGRRQEVAAFGSGQARRDDNSNPGQRGGRRHGH